MFLTLELTSSARIRMAIATLVVFALAGPVRAIAASTTKNATGWTVNNSADWSPSPPSANPLGAPDTACTGTSAPTGSWAQFSFSGFAIPFGDVVTGIEVRVKYRSGGTNTVQITNGGALVGSSKTIAAHSAQAFCSNTSFVSAGGAGDA